MRTRAFAFVVVAVMLSGLPGSSIASETGDKLEIRPGFSKDKSPAGVAGADDSKAIARLINDINAAAKENKRRTLSIITINTDVAGATLEQQAADTGFSFGEIYVAHSLALATRKKFSMIVALKKGGQSWGQIARANRVKLRGSAELLKEMTQQ
jgi:hypothetical protein